MMPLLSTAEGHPDMTSPSNSHPGGAAAAGGMLTAEPFGRYGRREGTTRRKSQVVDRSGTATELARVRARLAELDAEQRRLLQELSALEARETAEIAALPTLLTIILSTVPIREFNNCSTISGISNTFRSWLEKSSLLSSIFCFCFFNSISPFPLLLAENCQK